MWSHGKLPERDAVVDWLGSLNDPACGVLVADCAEREPELQPAALDGTDGLATRELYRGIAAHMALSSAVGARIAAVLSR